MSTANTALLYNLALLGTPVDDDIIGNGVASSQAGAPVLRSELTRITKAAANDSFVLKSILSGEANSLTFVVNDSANTIKVFCAIGETLGGVLNSSLSIPTGQSGIFVRVPNALGTPDWRAAAIP
jgi:hypothetical protein